LDLCVGTCKGKSSEGCGDGLIIADNLDRDGDGRTMSTASA
jgi:hypothetical protein